MMIAEPSSRSWRSLANRRCVESRSSAADDSSRISARGLHSSARPIVIHCLRPSGKVPTSVPGSIGRPVSSSISAAAAVALARCGMAREKSASAPRKRLSTTELSSATITSWKTVAMPTWRASCGEVGVWPKTSTWPLSGGSTPDSTLASVLLPQPLPPTMAWISPREALKLQPSSALVTPKVLRTPTTEMSRGADVREASRSTAGASSMVKADSFGSSDQGERWGEVVSASRSDRPHDFTFTA